MIFQGMVPAVFDAIFGVMAMFCFLIGCLGNGVSLVYFLKCKGKLFRITQILYTYIAIVGELVASTDSFLLIVFRMKQSTNQSVLDAAL